MGGSAPAHQKGSFAHRLSSLLPWVIKDQLGSRVFSPYATRRQAHAVSSFPAWAGISTATRFPRSLCVEMVDGDQLHPFRRRRGLELRVEGPPKKDQLGVLVHSRHLSRYFAQVIEHAESNRLTAPFGFTSQNHACSLRGDDLDFSFALAAWVCRYG